MNHGGFYPILVYRFIKPQHPVPGLAIKTLKEQGVDVELVNWRGLFANKSIEKEKLAEYQAMLKKLSKSDTWKSVEKKYGWNESLIMGDELDAFYKIKIHC